MNIRDESVHHVLLRYPVEGMSSRSCKRPCNPCKPCSCNIQEYLERCAALFAPAADIFGDDDDMFAENAENEPQQAPTSTAPSRISALTTPRVSFSFPEVMGDSNGSTPRLHSASPTDGPWQAHQPAESAAAQPLMTADTSDAVEHSTAVENGDAARPANGHLSAAEAEVDYHSWPIKELRRFLTERGLVSGCHAGFHQHFWL